MIEEAGATTETAKSLGIGASTLRKYAAALEEQGYRFERSANKSRLFKSDDIECIERLMTELREHNLPLVDAVVTVLSPTEGKNGGVSEQVQKGSSEQECAAASDLSSAQDSALDQSETMLSDSLAPLGLEQHTQLRSYEGLGQLVSEVTYGAVEPKQDDRVQLLQHRVDELELTLQHLAETHLALQEQMEKQRQWMNDKLEEERDRELVTNLRSYQGRKRKSKISSLRMLFGLLPKKHKEA
ncbi:MerR family transcriptional regulator [Paenibacillus silvae]|uniref:MerR family transcriptional regulator n=1 Tax=Paenibacillus silvae TaxID=1325358 RepID=A0A2W6NLM3_9BACL|nr:MerR family transcriptional regulator [Paenibacillus silvae]PZT56704.1 MerR family transcriptional regulator [Paenibacillus silvae]